MSFATLPRAYQRFALALALCMSAAPAAFAGEGSADGPDDCSRTYHSALQGIAETELPKLEAMRDLAFEGDPALPGSLMFQAAASRQRTEAETAALREANGLARRKGRARWAADAGSRWIADQIRRDLAAYLGQPHSPYLCGGVPAYLDTLRSYAGRIGASPAQRKEWAEAQENSAARSLDAALDAMKPAPLPRYAPIDRPGAGAIAGLRPAAGIDRVETHAILKRNASAADVADEASDVEEIVDPDLPPLSAKPGVPLGTERERIAALASLISAAKSGGFLKDWNSLGGDEAGAAPEDRPVLARLEAMRTLVSGAETPIRDRLVRSRLAAAFADIEALDYLAKADANGPDPMLGAIEATLDAINAAHRRACTCGD